MNVGFFTDTFSHFHGTEVSIVAYAKKFRQQGHNVYIFAPHENEENELNATCAKQGIQIHRYPSFPSTVLGQPDFRIALPWIWGIPREIKLDIIHTHAFPGFMNLLGAYLARKRYKSPLLHTYHILLEEFCNCVPLVGSWSMTKAFVRLLSRIYCNSCDLVVAPSQGIKTKLIKYGVLEEKVVVLPTGPDSEFFECGTADPATDKSNRASVDEKKLLYVGRLSLEKNIQFLLHVFKVILEELPSTRFFIVGHGPMEGRLKKLAERLNISGNVVFTGYVSQGLVRKYYALCHVLVFASTGETQAMVVSEAKAMGLPAVAIDAIAVSEAVRDNEDGFVIKPATKHFIEDGKTIEKFSEKVLDLLKNDLLREKFSNQAKRNARKMLSMDASVCLLRFYKEMLDRKLLRTVSTSEV